MSNQGLPPPNGLPPFELLLQRWESDVNSLERTGFEAQKIGAEFGRLGLSSAILLNGGALVALPPLMQWLNPHGRSLVAITSIWFPIGVFLAVVAILLAYVNFMCVSGSYRALARKRGRELDLEFQRKQRVGDKEHQRYVDEHRKWNIAVEVTRAVAVLFAIASYGAFAIGVFGFINLANFNTN